MFRFLAAALLGLGLLLSAEARAQQNVLRIAAVVNEDVISFQDLNERLVMVISSSNLPNTPDTGRRIAPQILRLLIDERLKLQEASKAGIEATQRDIDDALADIARNNNIPATQIDQFLARTGVPRNSLIERIKAEVAWSTFVSRRLRAQVRVSEEEVDETLARIEANKGATELQLAEIFLPVEDEAKAREVRALAERLIEQIRGGADFGVLAENFSQSPSGAQRGELGWVTRGQIEDEILDGLARLEPGTVAGPVEVPGGLIIYRVKGKRQAQGVAAPASEVTVELTQLVVATPPTPSAQQLSEAQARARGATANVKSCPLFRQAARSSGSTLSGDIGNVRVATLPPPIRAAVEKLPVATPSEPVQTQGGVAVFMVCAREGEAAPDASRQRIRQALVRERLELAARRHLRNLRREAFIDVRL